MSKHPDPASRPDSGTRPGSRPRLQPLRRATGPTADAAAGDAGFALAFVLLIAMLITAGVGTAIAVTTSNVAPARRAQSDHAAFAAAQAGLQRYLAYLNAQCRQFDTTACAAITDEPYAGAVGAAHFTVQVLNPTTYLYDGRLRVRSTGSAGDPARPSTRSLVADYLGLPSMLRFAYYTKFETLSGTFLNQRYPARAIRIAGQVAADATADAAHVAAGTDVTWQVSSGPTTDTSICDRLYYDDPGNAGAEHLGRNAVKHRQRAEMLPGGAHPGMDWAQSGSDGTMYQPCQVTFSHGMSFDGPVYTRDAPYLSNGVNGGDGPTFTVPDGESLAPVSTGWSRSDSPAARPHTPYHSFPVIGGMPSSTSTGYPHSTVQHAVYDLELPENADEAETLATCTYQGPTRIIIVGGTATITSPLTPAASSDCYQSDPNAYAPGTGGVYGATVPIASTLIYVANKGATPSRWGTASAKVLTHTDPTGADATQFQQDQSMTVDSYAAAVRAAWRHHLAADDTQTLQSLALAVLPHPGPSQLLNLLGLGSGHYRVIPHAAAPQGRNGSPLFWAGPSTSVEVQYQSCAAALLGLCISLSGWHTLFTITAAPRTFPAAGDITRYATWGATKANAPGDVYIEGTGVTGTLSVVAENDVILTGNLTTNTDTTTNPATGEPAYDSGGAVDLVADNNVRIYHPVTCANSDPDALAATTDGFCPNDITGLYDAGDPPSSVVTDAGAFGSAHPAMQYCNMTAASKAGATGDNSGNPNADCDDTPATGSGPITTIDAAIFALGSALAARNNAGPGANPMGSFYTDNYQRGVSLGAVTVTGGVYQLHRGATGKQWATLAATGARPSSGYRLSITYLDLQPANLPYVPPVRSGAGGNAWRLVSASTSSGGGP